MTAYRAMVMRSGGAPLDEVQREVPVPGPGQVLVRLRASSVNYHDHVNLLGLLDGPWPRSPMSDGAGEVEALGPGVTEWVVGDRVITTFHPDWIDGDPTPSAKRTLPGDTTDGCLQQYVCVPARSLASAPAHLDDVQAATLVCAGVTAWSSIEAAGIGPGHTVVAQGTGGVSLFVVQIAKALGATVILTSSSDQKLEIGRRLGADHGVNYKTHPEWQKEVRRLNGGRGADLVVDVGGPATLGHSILSTRMGGTVTVTGVLSGVGNSEIPLAYVMLNNIHLVGITVGSVAAHVALASFVSEHRIVPHVSHRLGWDQMAEAMRVMQANEHVGKIGIVIP